MALATGIGLLAVFSLLSLLWGDEDTRTSYDPRDDTLLWMFLTRR